MKLYKTLVAMGSKEAGSIIGRRAGKYIYSYLEKHFPDHEIREEKFQIDRQKPLRATLLFQDIKIEGQLYENTGVTGSEIDGPVKVASLWSLFFRKKSFSGKIIIFRQNILFHRVWLVLQAYENGALGVIYVPRKSNHILAGLGYPYLLGSCDIPVIGVLYEQYCQLIRGNPQRIRIAYSSALDTHLQCRNIILRSPRTRRNKAPVIALGAHYDSWYGGASDNCIAVQLMTDVYQMLSKKNLRHPIQALFFDAEEVGLLGSVHHMTAITKQDYAFYFNFEMPLPVQSGIINTLFYSDHEVCKRAIRSSNNFREPLIPIPLKTFYRFLPGFPADLNSFYHAGIPCISTFCHNPLAHTPWDDGDNLRWQSYPVIREILFKTICEVDRVL